MKSKPKVGVVVPTYNRKSMVETTIDSLLHQDAQFDYKIVVVDDGSIDGTFEHLAEKYGSEIDSIEDQISGHVDHRDENKKMILIRQKNKRAAGARNTGLKKLYGLGCEYFAPHDSDDLALSNKYPVSLRIV